MCSSINQYRFSIAKRDKKGECNSFMLNPLNPKIVFTKKWQTAAIFLGIIKNLLSSTYIPVFISYGFHLKRDII